MHIRPNLLYLGNAFTLLERLESNFVTLAYIDAPWNIQSFVSSGHSEDRAVAEVHYLKFMASIFQHIHRVLRNDGTLWYHLDRHYSTIFRILLDEIFGRANYISDIILPMGKRYTASSTPFAPDHDTILVYSKTRNYKLFPQPRIISQNEMTWLYPHQDAYGQYRLDSLTSPLHAKQASHSFSWQNYTPPSGVGWRYSQAVLDKFAADDLIYYPTNPALPKLKRYLDDHTPKSVGSLWDDFDFWRESSATPFEHRFPAQKPVTLLERIISMATSPGDLALDPFCGSGTTLIAADKLKRAWIGSDILPEAYQISSNRLQKVTQCEPSINFTVTNEATLIATLMPQKVSFPDLSHLWAKLGINFVLGAQAPVEEQRNCECKEIKGNNPVDTIKNTIDEYVVAFLNGGGEGHIYWGITNESLTVVGVKLSITQRDNVRRLITDQISTIQPPLNPSDFPILFWRVHDNNVKPIEDVYVVEVIIPSPNGEGPWLTSSDKLFVKTEAGKKHLKGKAMIDFIAKRPQYSAR